MGERSNQEIQDGDEAEGDSTLLRWCSYHKALHPLSAFSRVAKAADQLSWWCREGQRIYRLEHRRPYLDKDRERYQRRAARRSIELAAQRKVCRPYRSKYNPLGLLPEERNVGEAKRD